MNEMVAKAVTKAMLHRVRKTKRMAGNKQVNNILKSKKSYSLELHQLFLCSFGTVEYIPTNFT